MLRWALAYVNHGFAVFPLKPNDKTPLTAHGLKDATTDPSQVQWFWSRHPNANIGIATGSASGGLLVIDEDVDETKGIDGKQTLQDWLSDRGEELPETWNVITGRGGEHLYYRYDPTRYHFKNRAGIIDGVDIRAEGGYVVAPPSVHRNGNLYQFDLSPEYGDEIADINETILDFLSIGTVKESIKDFNIPSEIESGTRNDVLYRTACSLQAKGLSDNAIWQALVAENDEKCNPPLDQQELLLLCKSALTHEKGKPIATYSDGESDLPGWHTPVWDLNPVTGKILNTRDNYIQAIHYDPKLYKHIRYNELSYSLIVDGAVPWDSGNEGIREWNNADDSALQTYLETTYRLSGVQKYMDAINNLMFTESFNPVEDMLNDCYSKYGKSEGYIRKLLPKYMGVVDSDYQYEVMKIVMLGAISRAFRPGVKFDYTMVLVGGQGIGKSTFTRLLANGDDWYDGNFNTIEGDKAADKLRGKWIVEMGELLAMKKAKEKESIKAFLTSTSDNYRPAYARRSENRKRTTVFIGTTNDYYFLSDPTGNRRFLPIECNADHIDKKIYNNLDEARDDIQHAWGEAMRLYIEAEKHPSLKLPDAIEPIAGKMQADHTEDDSWIGMIEEYLAHDEVRRVCAVQLYQEAIMHRESDPNKTELNRIHQIMRNITTWKRYDKSSDGRAKCGGYGKQLCYIRITD